MFNDLNVNSRDVIFSLCQGNAAKLGKKKLPAIENQSRHLLALLSVNLSQLRELKGKDLVDKVIVLDSGFNFEDVLAQIDKPGGTWDKKQTKHYRLGKLKTYSFRGLAPAGTEWEYDFEGKSHLIYGPNGCGKSSLLGAICWCLTGNLFRDDCPPCEPEKIIAYPLEGAAGGRIERDAAQALIDENGNSSSATTPYWVELQFRNNNTEDGTKGVYLKRNSADGFSWSIDGNNWSTIKNISEIAIEELDAELRVLMPAKVTHMQFGKNADLSRLLAEVAGYGDLESVAEVAEGLSSNSKRSITSIEKNELEPENRRIQECIKQIQESADDKIKELPSYKNLCKDSRTKEDIAAFGMSVNEQIDVAKAQLAEDLGLEIPDKKDAPKYKEWQTQSNNLPGQISNLLSELEKPFEEIFSNSFGLDIPTADEMEKIEEKLSKFEDLAKAKIEEFLQWAKRKASKKKLDLMLKAASFFPEKSNACPVCDQSLDKVLKVKAELEELREFSSKEYLQKEVDDFVRSLEAELEAIISSEKCNTGSKNFSQRILEDWMFFKKTHCKELLLSVAERFDSHIKGVVNEIKQDTIAPFEISYDGKTESVKTFSPFAQKIDNAKRFGSLCRWINSNKNTMSKKLQLLLIHSEEKSEITAFKEILERAKSNNEILRKLIIIQSQARELWKSTEKVEEIKNKIKTLTLIVDSAEPIKEIKNTIRSEVKDMVTGDLGKKTEEYYNSLYDKEVLEFAQLTTGHAANPDVRGEINLYLKAGSHQVPMGPFSNAGRMRALLLSFAFALIKKSSGSLDFIVLDDPALSLDDEHKKRFFDHLVEPLIQNSQVFIGTHYRSFFKDCEYAFDNNVKLKMIPRRRSADIVQFEPGDLLERVEIALQKKSGEWEEAAGNIRKWIERTMATLSGYCPIPFLADKLGPSIDNYASITDIRIATPERDNIIKILRSTKIDRIADAANHDEPIQKPDIEDALKEIKKCLKAVRSEIWRFKQLYNHALAGRKIGDSDGIVINLASFKNQCVDKSIHVVHEAAAAHNGQGIDWDTNEKYSLKEYSIIQVCSDIISPIAQCGQYVLLGSTEVEPDNGDLVSFEAPDSQKYLRRFWRDSDGTIILEGANPTKSFKPIRINSGRCNIRRIVGVLYKQDQPSCNDAEWSLSGFADSWFNDTVGIRIKGTSLEPIARDGQIILIKKQDIKTAIRDDMLACVSIEGVGDVIKRCHVKDSQLILVAINPNEREVPIVTKIESIQQAYELKGVLFEVDSRA